MTDAKPIVEPPVDPQLGDLQEWVRGAFEEAYQRWLRDHGYVGDDHSSREDIAYGWISCLLYLRSYGAFRPRTAARDQRNETRVEMSMTPRSAEEQRVWDAMQEARQNMARERKDWGS